MNRLCLAALVTFALALASIAHAALVTMDIDFDLDDATYNPAYGTTFINLPGFATVASVTTPVTLHAGDTFQLNYHFLPGQSLRVDRLTGASYQQLFVNFMDQSFYQGVIGTYDFEFHGVAGDPIATQRSGNLNGANTLLFSFSPLTQSSFSFTGFSATMEIDAFRRPGDSLTTHYLTIQVYGDHVAPGRAPAVPDSAATAPLLAAPLALLVWSRRRAGRAGSDPARC